MSLGDAIFGVHPGFQTFDRELQQGVNSAVQKVNRGLKPISPPVDTSSAKKGLLDLQTVARTVAGSALVLGFKKAIDTVSDYTSSIRLLSATTGASAEDASRFQFVLDRLNIPTSAVARSFVILSRNIQAGKDSFTKYFTSAQLATLRTGELTKAVPILAKAYQGLATPAARNAFLMETLGRNSIQLRRLLALSSDEFRTISAEADRFGLVLTENNLEAFRQFTQEGRAVGQSLKGLEVELVGAALPALSAFAKGTVFAVTGLRSLIGPVAPVVAGAATLAVALGGVAAVGTVVAGGLGTVAAGAKVAAGAAIDLGGSLLVPRQAFIGFAADADKAAIAQAQFTAEVEAGAGTLTTSAALGIGAVFAVVLANVPRIADAIENSLSPGIVDARKHLEDMATAAQEADPKLTHLGQTIDIGPVVAKTDDKLKDLVGDFADTAAQANRLSGNFGLVIAATKKYSGDLETLSQVLTLIENGHTRAAEKIIGLTSAQAAAAQVTRQNRALMEELTGSVGAQQGVATATAVAQDKLTVALHGVGTTSERGQRAIAAYAASVFQAKVLESGATEGTKEYEQAKKDALQAALDAAKGIVDAASAAAKAEDDLAAHALAANQSLLSGFVSRAVSIMQSNDKVGGSAQSLADKEDEANRQRIRGNLDTIASFTELVNTELEGNQKMTQAQLEADRQRVASNLQLIASFQDITGAQKAQPLEGPFEGFGLSKAQIEAKKRELSGLADTGIKDFSKATSQNARNFAQFISDVNAIFKAGAPNLAAELLQTGPSAAFAARQAALRIGKKDGLGALEDVASTAVKSAKKKADDELEKWGANFAGMGAKAAEGLDTGLSDFVNVTQRNTRVFQQFFADVNALFRAGAPALAKELLQLGPSGATAARQAAEQIGTGGLKKLESVAEGAIKAAKVVADKQLDLWGPNFAEKGTKAGAAVKSALDKELSLADWTSTTAAGVKAFEQFSKDVNAIFDAGAPALAQTILSLGAAGAQVARQAAGQIAGGKGLGSLEKLAVGAINAAKQKGIDPALQRWQPNFLGKGRQAVDALRKGMDKLPELRDQIGEPIKLKIDSSDFDPKIRGAIDSLNEFGLIPALVKLHADGSEVSRTTAAAIRDVLGLTSKDWKVLIHALTAPGEIEGINRQIENAARDRHSTVILGFKVDDSLNDLILDRSGISTNDFGVTGIGETQIGKLKLAAQGGQFFPGERVIVGEAGSPELVEFGAKGGRVTPLGGAAGPIVGTLIVQEVANDPRATGFAVARQIAFEAQRG